MMTSLRSYYLMH